MNSKPVAFFVLKVWPEPDSSAAGTRIMQIIDMLADTFEIHLASTAAITELTPPDLDQNATLHQIKVNDSAFNQLISEIQPAVVIFDRYMTEEQFGWRVAETCPDALRILDTEDLHFLRFAREQSVLQGGSDIFPFLHTDQTYRELASIWRSDLSLIISGEELDLLRDVCDVKPSLLYYLPLFLNERSDLTNPEFGDRKHLMMIGNGHHRPNNDAVQYVHNEIWPELRTHLKDAEIHIYGAYLPENIRSLHDPEGRFMVKGRADDVHMTLSNYKVLLAPLRFGAGLKGKLLDAIKTATPSVTTRVGAEGIARPEDWPGYCGDDTKDLISATKNLYTNKTLWTDSQRRSEAIRPAFQLDAHHETFLRTISEYMGQLKIKRDANFTSRMIWHQGLRSTEFMSRWIEEKNKRK